MLAGGAFLLAALLLAGLASQGGVVAPGHAATFVAIALTLGAPAAAFFGALANATLLRRARDRAAVESFVDRQKIGAFVVFTALAAIVGAAALQTALRAYRAHQRARPYLRDVGLRRDAWNRRYGAILAFDDASVGRLLGPLRAPGGRLVDWRDTLSPEPGWVVTEETDLDLDALRAHFMSVLPGGLLKRPMLGPLDEGSKLSSRWDKIRFPDGRRLELEVFRHEGKSRVRYQTWLESDPQRVAAFATPLPWSLATDDVDAARARFLSAVAPMVAARDASALEHLGPLAYPGATLALAYEPTCWTLETPDPLESVARNYAARMVRTDVHAGVTRGEIEGVRPRPVAVAVYAAGPRTRVDVCTETW